MHKNKCPYVTSRIQKINQKERSIAKINELVLMHAAELDAILSAELGAHGLTTVDAQAFQTYVNEFTQCAHTPNPTVSSSMGDANIEISSESAVESPIDLLMRDLYKKLILKVHPDKQTKYSSLSSFNAVQSAFDQRDVYNLICFGDRIGILKSNDLDSNTITLILEKKMYQLKKQTQNQKNTIGYKYIICEDHTCIQTYVQSVKLHKENIELRAANKQLQAKLAVRFE